MELILGILLGNAAKGSNPLEIIIGLFVGWIAIALMAGIAMLAWNYAPQAASLLDAAGLYNVFPFSELYINDGNIGFFGKEIFDELPKRVLICAIAIFLVSIGITIFLRLLMYSLKGIFAVYDLTRRNQQKP
jgi:cadmium resistance protein CadD (predicted permease)